MTRKAFLSTAATGAGLLLLGQAVKTLGSEEVIRPPLVTDETEFASKCLRCYRCIELCPTGVLVPASIENGLLAMRTPTMDFHRGSCTFCNICSQICPTQAIVAGDPLKPQHGRIGIAVVQIDRCVAYYSGCRECYKKCPYGAISLTTSGYPVVDEDVCNGCGVCVEICPALVYRSFSGGNRRGMVIVKDQGAAESMKQAMHEWTDTDA